ncbi:TPA: hypothetical protein ACIWSC_005612, partial [Escherichia coli]
SKYLSQGFFKINISRRQDYIQHLCTSLYPGGLPPGQISKEGANKRGNSSRLTQSFHFFMFEPIFSPVNALNQPI